MPITTNDVYSLLGELLHNCQRIEWVMKYLVEQACREIEFKTVEELKEPPKIESKWEQNTDTLGTVIKAYLHGFYDEPVEDDSDGDCIKIQVKYSFNSDADASVRALNCRRRKEECDELVAIRNFLAHQFALKYPLQDEEKIL